MQNKSYLKENDMNANPLRTLYTLMAAACIILSSLGGVGCRLINLDPPPVEYKPPIYLNRVVFSDLNTGTIVGSGGTILRTADAGETWRKQSVLNFSDNLNGVFFVDSMHGTAVGGSIIHTTDGGSNWEIAW